MVRNELFVNPPFIGTDYMNIVFANPFANKMFASVYSVLRKYNANASFGPAKAGQRVLHSMFSQLFAANQILSIFSQT